MLNEYEWGYKWKESVVSISARAKLDQACPLPGRCK